MNIPTGYIRCQLCDQLYRGACPVHGVKSSSIDHLLSPPSPNQTKYFDTQERKMHIEYGNWLEHHRHELYWDHSRMDKKTRNRKGHPDFVIQAMGAVLNLEMKAAGKKPDEDQKRIHTWIQATGGFVHIVFSSDDAIRLTKEWFKLLTNNPKRFRIYE